MIVQEKCLDIVSRTLAANNAKSTSELRYYLLQKPHGTSQGGRAAKRVRKNEDGAVNVDDLWEEKNPGVEPGEDSDCDTAPSPEDWHSRVPNVRHFLQSAMF